MTEQGIHYPYTYLLVRLLFRMTIRNRDNENTQLPFFHVIKQT